MILINIELFWSKSECFLIKSRLCVSLIYTEDSAKRPKGKKVNSLAAFNPKNENKMYAINYANI